MLFIYLFCQFTLLLNLKKKIYSKMPSLKQLIFSKISYPYSTSCLNVFFTLLLQVKHWLLFENMTSYTAHSRTRYFLPHVSYSIGPQCQFQILRILFFIKCPRFEFCVIRLYNPLPISIKTNYLFSPWPFLLISSSLSFSLTLSVLFLHSSIATHSYGHFLDQTIAQYTSQELYEGIYI